MCYDNKVRTIELINTYIFSDVKHIVKSTKEKEREREKDFKNDLDPFPIISRQTSKSNFNLSKGTYVRR